MCRLSGGWRVLLSEHWHDTLLWFWPRQRLHTLPGQVTVAVGTVTFEFPGLCLEFCLHNAVTSFPLPLSFSLLFGISLSFFNLSNQSSLLFLLLLW